MKYAAAYLERIKSAIAVSQIVGADIPLRRAGSEWTACCPFHRERSPSFFVNDQKAFFHCFGCGTHGDAITWLMRYRSVTFDEAVEIIAGEKPPTDAQAFENNLRARTAEHVLRRGDERPLSDDQRSQQAKARAIWQNRLPLAASKGEAYLRYRGITLRRLPPTLGFLEHAWHGWERIERPALIGAVQDGSGRVTAIQTTFLRPDGLGKAGIDPAKPVTGPMTNGAVRLGKPAEILGIAEGIETALSAQQLYSLPVWATLGASRLGAVKLPEVVRTVIIFADNGERGKAEAEKAAKAYVDQDRTFQIEFPPEGLSDWNEVVRPTSMAA